jgi:adenylate cyclase
MDARLERKLRSPAVVVAFGLVAGIVFGVARGRTSPTYLAVGVLYGLLMSVSLGSAQFFVFEGPMREWLGGLSFAASVMVRSAICVAIITFIQWFELGEVIAGLTPDTSSKAFWFSFIYSVVLSVVMLGATVRGSRRRAAADSRTRRWHRRGGHRRAGPGVIRLCQWRQCYP